MAKYETGDTMTDLRPSNCRNRLRDEGKTYPRSGCAYCHDGGLFGCPLEDRKRGFVGAKFRVRGVIDVVTCVREIQSGDMLCLEFDKMPGKYFRHDLCEFVAPRENATQTPTSEKHDMSNSKPINRITLSDVAEFKNNLDLFGNNALIGYQHIAVKSAIYPGKGTPFGLMYAALGLAEAGEVQNKVKKAFRDDGVIEFVDNAYDDEQTMHKVVARPLTLERKAQIIKELGGVLWYIAAVCDEIGATMSEVALQNLEELCSRGERGTLQGDGDDR